MNGNIRFFAVSAWILGHTFCLGQNAEPPLPAATQPVTPAAPLTLVRDQQPVASIVLAQKPTRAASLAAHELQTVCLQPFARKLLRPLLEGPLCLQPRQNYARAVRENDRRILEAWGAAAPKNPKYLWLYYCFLSLVATQQQYRCFPGFFAHTLWERLGDYQRAGISGLIYEPSYLFDGQRTALLDQVESHLTWKLLDDPTLDGRNLFDEFFDRYYGAAAAPMKARYCQIEDIYGNPANYPPGYEDHQTEPVAWGNPGTEPRMKQLATLMEQARTLARSDLEKRRVALFGKGATGVNS